MSGRDYQRSKVYNAEWELQEILDRAARDQRPLVQIAGIPLTLPPEAKFATIESVQAYVDRVLALPEVAAINPHGPITVRPLTSDSTSAYYQDGQIAVPVGRCGWALREFVILHEVAHHLTRREAAGHGPRFAEAELELLDAVMGPEIALALRITFDDHKVKTEALVSA